MARYEHFRTYVVKSIGKDTVVVAAPKGRGYHSQIVFLDEFSKKTLKGLKVGSKVTMVRKSTLYSTYYTPKA